VPRRVSGSSETRGGSMTPGRHSTPQPQPRSGATTPVRGRSQSPLACREASFGPATLRLRTK
jgi:hypothetical protein